MVYSRRQAMQRAALADAYPVGMCARWTREQYGIGPSGDADHDGDVDALDAWARSVGKHAGDRNPPPGVPVFYAGGRSGHGHAAMSWYNGLIRSTDAPNMGHVGNVALNYPERVWGLTYLGWAEGMSGVLIPDDITPKRQPALVAAAVKALVEQLKTAGPIQAKRIRAALAKLREIKPR